MKLDILNTLCLCIGFCAVVNLPAPINGMYTNYFFLLPFTNFYELHFWPVRLSVNVSLIILCAENTQITPFQFTVYNFFTWLVATSHRQCLRK